ncbi:ethanolamine ammonia-lyase subunit EutB [Shigella boydii]
MDDIAFTRKGLTSGSGRGGSGVPLERGPDLRREENAGNQKGQYHHRYSGTFSARLQPNDTRDDVQSPRKSTKGFPFGWAMRVIGVNPVTDDVENLSRVLDTIYGVIDKFNIPTEGCVLADHLTTQIEAIRRGAPGGLIFQPICGSEKGLKEFGAELAMLTKRAQWVQSSTCIAGKNCLYFETGTRFSAIRWR